MGQWDMGVNKNVGQWSKIQVFIYKVHFTGNYQMLKYEFEGVMQIITQ